MGLKQTSLINVGHICFFSLIIHIIYCKNVLQNININGGTWIKEIEWKFIYRGVIFLSPNLLFSCYFSKKFTTIFRSDRSTYTQDIFHNFYTFQVKTHIIAEESFRNKNLATLFEYNSWDRDIKPFFFCRVLLTINSKVDIKFQPFT